MTIGDPSNFAIESVISEAYDQVSTMGLGYFVLHILGQCYGVRELDATLLGCSFSEVERRLENRGLHILDCVSQTPAGQIADALRIIVYGAPGSSTPVNGTFYEAFTKHLSVYLWAPDGDAAFDDGSYVLHFDIGRSVRLIAFRCNDNGLHDQTTLTDLWLTQIHFYGLLNDWRSRFYAEWIRLASGADTSSKSSRMDY